MDTFERIRELLAEQLKARIAQISREKSERDAIFSSLSEGVVMLDMEGEIIDINAAACRIFELASPHPQGTLAGLVRHRAFEDFIRSVRNDLFHPDETELTLSLPSGERQLKDLFSVIFQGNHFPLLLILIGAVFTAIIQSGEASEEVVAACNKHEIAMLCTDMRHFKN